MTEPVQWSPDRDPARDDTLARLLRQVDGTAPADRVDWERLHAGILARVAAADPAPRAWWNVLVQWRRLAVAASLAAMLGAAALVWEADSGASELELGDAIAPEAAALARVVAAYPDDAVFTSLIQTARSDVLISWGEQ
ncbi:MAG TPA: hypothetical protein VMY76_17435 [Gemmatimonadales bacterium]|nr:hypothetical protein [Gemmatimonadales bacterium]